MGARALGQSNMLPKLDVARSYVNEDGTRMTDSQLHRFPARGVAHDRDRRRQQGQSPVSSRATARAQIVAARSGRSTSRMRRLLHRLPEASIGEKSLYRSARPATFSGIAKDIALVENFGPEPRSYRAKFFRDQAMQEEITADPARAGAVKQATPSGPRTSTTTSQARRCPWRANGWRTASTRCETFSPRIRLGTAAAISSISDEGTLAT
jgi:hypothetical protein